MSQPLSKDAQFDLFGEHSSDQPSEPPLLQMPQGLADQALWMGTSSWAFPGWGRIYPPGLARNTLSKQGLTLYSQHPLLNAVGLDRTYYGPLGETELRAYAEQVPDSFRFMVKAYRGLSTPANQLPYAARPQREYFLDPEFATRHVIAPAIAGLGEHLGALVFQFPPLSRSFTAEPASFLDRLDGFLRRLPASDRYGVELRNPELYTHEYFALLDGRGVNHCFTVHPGAPTLADQLRAAKNRHGKRLLLRWNLNRRSRYREARERFAPFDRLQAEDADTRDQVTALVLQALGSGKPAMVTANNKAEGSAPLTIEKLAACIAQRLPPRVAGLTPFSDKNIHKKP